VAGTETQAARAHWPARLAASRFARALALALAATLAYGTASAFAAPTGTIPAIGVNDIRGDGILLPNQSWNGVADLSFVSSAGAELYRAPLHLNCVDPNYTGTFNFSVNSPYCDNLNYDTLVRTLADDGMTWLPVLINDNRTTGAALPPTSSGAGGSPTISEFAAFAAAAVARYGPSGSFWGTCGCTYEPIQAWEVWNEENNGAWWGGDASADAYASVFSAVRTALRGVDPQARVVVGGLAFDPNGQSSFVQPAQMIQALSANNANAFDAVAIHPYTDAQGESSEELAQSAIAYVNQTAATLVASTGPSATGGPRQQIWVSEMGWSSTDNTDVTIAGGFQDFIGYVDGGARAGDNIGPILWYMLRDNSTVSSRDDALGLRYTNANGSDNGPKPIWSAFSAAAQSEGTLALPAALSDSGPYVAPPPASTTPPTTGATSPTTSGTTKGSSGAKSATAKKTARRCTKVTKHHHTKTVCRSVRAKTAAKAPAKKK
jgi:hypothetical protein